MFKVKSGTCHCTKEQVKPIRAAEHCLENNATQSAVSYRDLVCVRSLGFRGSGLPKTSTERVHWYSWWISALLNSILVVDQLSGFENELSEIFSHSQHSFYVIPVLQQLRFILHLNLTLDVSRLNWSQLKGIISKLQSL